VPADALVVVSSQLPVGTTARLERHAAGAGRHLRFAYSPENLRLGRALDAFLRPARVVVGVRGAEDRGALEPLFAGITDEIVWMTVESAEMTKHALNAFLATTVAFTNEIATVCEQVGADAREVEQGLRSEPRVGPRAYVSPGAAFAGGTLARDVTFLGELGRTHRRPTPLLDAVLASNGQHRAWPLRTLEDELGAVAGRTVAVLGLTYTAGTSTLRRSAAVELCRALVERDAVVRAHDPRAEALPPELHAVTRAASAEAALDGAEAVVVSTGWPEYRTLPTACFSGRVVVDADGVLAEVLRDDPAVRYRSVGSVT
jgi:UDPglucose 6-dehydrogenase